MKLFKIVKKSSQSQARAGILTTHHKEVETPSLVAVATQGAIKTLTQEQVKLTGTQIAIANTYHLHIRPGEEVIKMGGGLHKFMSWDKPLMTDSGGFQAFSFGFGKDVGFGKISFRKHAVKVNPGAQPQNIKISDEGIEFRSYVDGQKLFLNPQKSIQIQEKLGADIIFSFDECPPPNATKKYLQQALPRIHRWAKESLDSHKTNQFVFGIVQGGRFRDLRLESAKYISSLPFNGFGIGGEMGVNSKNMISILNTSLNALPADKPRHLLGNGRLEDIKEIIKSGIDLFDCVIPTHFARHGVTFTSVGKLDLGRSIYLKDFSPLDKKCLCQTCQNYTKSYLSHLFRAKEIGATAYLTIHNLSFYNRYISFLRKQILSGKL